METLEKLKLLSCDAQYDLSCACGTRSGETYRKRNADGSAWLYPVTLASGGSAILLKTLLSNVCTNDCKYCPLRAAKDPRRLSLSPDETARFFMSIYRRQRLYGIFLSSGVAGNADASMSRLIDTAAILRKKYQYKGYIHLKTLPGASHGAIDEALRFSTAVSLNIEAPGEARFKKLSNSKDYLKDIIDPMVYLSRQTARGAPYHGRHITTQFIVGASDESDREITRYAGAIYSRLRYQRLYFSAYQKGLGEPSLPGEARRGQDILTREHRLYQMDFLLRKYKWTVNDILFDAEGNLSLECDPKEVWAKNHKEFFPVNARTAAPEELLRVPGIGPVLAERIIQNRKDAVWHSISDILPKSAVKRSAGYLCL